MMMMIVCDASYADNGCCSEGTDGHGKDDGNSDNDSSGKNTYLMMLVVHVVVVGDDGKSGDWYRGVRCA